MTAIEQPRTKHQHADLIWGDKGTPISARFDDPYFSLTDGAAETSHVFLAGNDLPDRLAPGFQIAELGFGTGLNLVVLASVTPEDCPIQFTSFEAFPMTGAQAARALSALGNAIANEDHCDAICRALDKGDDRFQVGSIAVELILGDANQCLKDWNGVADAWFLDGFSPAKNPEMWYPDLMLSVASHTKTGGTFATFTAAGAVRRSLSEAGFQVERLPGYGRKRHMTRGTKL